MNREDIQKYLREEAVCGPATRDFIDTYRFVHQSRGKNRYQTQRRYRGTYYPHGSEPYCKLCNEVVVVGDIIYLFYVGGHFKQHVSPYHKECVHDHLADWLQVRRIKSIVSQDRGNRSRPNHLMQHQHPDIRPEKKRY